MTLVLRDYQERGLEEIRRSYRGGRRRPLYVLPTGGGKTVMYAAIARGAAQRGKRVLILEHRKELIRQASVALARIGVRHQLVCPTSKLAAIRRAHVEKVGWPMVDASSDVAVASVQTLAVRMDWLRAWAPDLIVIDEAHHAVAGTWARVIEACPDALLLGVTATPCRTSGQGLGEQAGGVFDELILGPSMREMIDAAWLLPPRLIAPPVLADFSRVRRSADGDLRPDDLEDALDDPRITGDAIEHYARIAPGRPAIVFASTLRHAAHVADAFRAAGWRFEVIHGALEDDVRDRLIEDLASGALHGLVSKDLISEGTDIPVAEVAIFLRRTESESFYLQACGRVLRPVFADGFDLSCVDGRRAAIAASGKPCGVIIDHVGNSGRMVDGVFVPRHGRPHDDRAWSLRGRRRRRKKEEAAEAPALRCPQCYAVDPVTPVCECGHAFSPADLGQAPKREAVDPVVVDGQLIEVSDAVAVRADLRRAQAAARTVDQLVAATGMDERRARKIIEARAEKQRLQAQLRDLCSRWADASRVAPGARSQALLEAFGFVPGDVPGMKPAALRAAVEAVTGDLLRLQLGDVDPGVGFALRASRGP